MSELSELIDQLEEFIESTKHLPAQKSTEWLHNRINTVGASEIKDIYTKKTDTYNSYAKLVASKLGTTKSLFTGNVSTRFGNLFENVARIFTHYITQCKTPIYETGSLPGSIKGQSYSPDGLGIVELLYDDKKYGATVLFEFKCPPKTEPNGSVPSQYIHQLQSGLSTVDIAHYMIFVNSSFRKCSFDNLDYSAKYDTNFHNDSRFKTPLKQTYAYGLIGFYIKDDTQHIHECIDYGPSDENTFNTILEQVEQGIVSVWYSEISYNNNINTIEYVNVHNPDLPSIHYDKAVLFNNFESYCSINNYKKIGILPWKLCRVDVILVERDPKWESKTRVCMKKFWDVVNEIKSSDNPTLAYYNKFPDTNITLDTSESLYDDSDSDTELFV